MLGVWLALSPFIFAAGPRSSELMICGGVVIALALASFWRPVEWAHLLIGAVALWLIGSGYFTQPRPGPPAAQNEIVSGLLLMMLFIVPNEATEPPKSWRRFHSR